jgi:hypothetical protein
MLQKLVSPNLACSLLNRVAYARVSHTRTRNGEKSTHLTRFKKKSNFSLKTICCAIVANAARRECSSETSAGKFYGLFLFLFSAIPFAI